LGIELGTWVGIHWEAHGKIYGELARENTLEHHNSKKLLKLQKK
jgi:hypothetical protein